MTHLFVILLPLVMLVGQIQIVEPQAPQPDGSIVHEVRQGDTFEGILIAYADLGVTVEDLLVYNNWRFEPQFIFVGDLIIILPPGSVDPTTGAVLDVPSAPSEPTPLPALPSIERANPVNVAPFLPGFDTNGTVVQPVQPWLPTIPNVPAETPVPTPTEVAVEPTPQPTASPTMMPTASPEATTVGTTPTEPTLEPTTNVTEVAPTEVAIIPETLTPTVSPELVQEDIAPPQDMPPTEVAVISDVIFTGRICATFYQDINQNGVLDADETLLNGGTIELVGANPVPNSEGRVCLEDVEPGLALVNVTAPDAYGFLAGNAYWIEVGAGYTQDIVVGAVQDLTPLAGQQRTPVTNAPPIPTYLQPVENTPESRSITDFSGILVLGLAAAIFLTGTALVVWYRVLR